METKKIRLEDYRRLDRNTYVKKDTSVIDKYCDENGNPYYINLRVNEKWGYIDDNGIEYYVLFI